MFTRLLIPAISMLVSVGCSSTAPLPMATTAEKARPAIEQVLNSWKAGKTAEELKALSPPLYLLDADFTHGSKLVDFKIDGEGRPYGTGYRFDTTITVENAGKPASAKKLAYRVVTEPNTCISREDD